MRAGELRHRIQLQSATEAQDSTGNPTKTWSTYDTVWAASLSQMSREFWLMQRHVATVTHVLKIRYRPTVKATDRVLFDGRTLEINGVVDPEARRRELHLACTEVKDA